MLSAVKDIHHPVGSGGDVADRGMVERLFQRAGTHPVRM